MSSVPLAVIWIYFLSVLHHCRPSEIIFTEQCKETKNFTVNPDADVKFTVIATLRQSKDGVNCGSTISHSAMKHIAGIQWIVDRMNTNNFIEGIKIGFDVHDDCGIPRKSMAQALDVLEGPLLGSPECSSGSTPCNIGIIGGTQSSTTEAILYSLDGTALPVIGPYATYSNLSRYTNYYRTIPTNIHQIQATVELLQQLGMTYIAVVHTDDDFGRYSAKALKETGKENGICVDSIQTIIAGSDINKDLLKHQRGKTKHNSLRVVYFGTRTIYNKMLTELGYDEVHMYNISWIFVENPEDPSPPLTPASGLDNGTIIVSQSVNTVNDFDNYLIEKFNSSKLASDYVEFLMGCSEKDFLANIVHKDISSTIDAVFVLADALQRQANFYCNGMEEFCKELRGNFKFKLTEVQSHPIIYSDLNENVTVAEYAENDRRVNFDDVGEFLPDNGMLLYDTKFVSGEANFTKIGSYHNGTLNIETDFQENISSTICYIDCEICESKEGISFAFLDGDTFLLGIFAVHETDPNDPFRCSKFRDSLMDVIIVESFLFSVEQMRNETGIKFGAIALDDCYSSAQTELVLSQIMSGEVTLINPYTGGNIDVSRVAAVVMTVSSSVTIPVGLLMTELKIPVISAAASTPDLDDRINFPYFLRTVPSDIEQARALIDIIKEMQWEYVSVLYVENNYGSKGKEAFVQLAKQNGICVADAPEAISDVKDDDSELIRVNTRLINQRADVVVYFGTESRITHFLQVVKGENDFIFLASEDWGDRQYILDLGKRRTLGSITLKNNVDSLLNNPMADYFRKISPENIPSRRNPWFVEYWEEKFKCDLPESFRNKYDKVCDESVKFTDEEIIDFVEDQRIVHTYYAISALVNALHKSQSEFCNPNLPGPEGNIFPCQKYFQYIDNVVQYIKEIELNRGGESVRVFKDDGNGNIGFTVNNVQEDDDKNLVYKAVGSFEEGRLTLQKQDMKFYLDNLDGTCPAGFCEHCSNGNITTPVTMATTTPSSSDTDKFSIPDFTVIGVLGFLFLTIVIVCIVISCFFKRRIRELEAQLKETKYEIRTGYALQNTSHIHSPSVTYPELRFANTSPSGGTIPEWSNAQNVLNGGNSRYRQPNGGIVNQGFLGNEMYLHATHDEEVQQQQPSSPDASPRGHHANPDQVQLSSSESPVYRPPSTSYGITSHSSFKKPANANQNGQIKKQPRTQLVVPPCRPELPPRDSEQMRTNVNRTNGVTDQFEHTSPGVPKEKVRKVRSSPRRHVSPPSFKQNHSPVENHWQKNPADSSKYNGYAPSWAFPDNKLPAASTGNLAGSMEKISRV